MNKTERLDLARWAAAHAKKSGASDASVNLSYARSIQVRYRDKKLEQLQESTQNSLMVRIYANNRYSGHTTNDLRKESLQKFIEEAVAMTKYLSEDPYRTLPDPKYYAGQENIDLKTVDPAYETVTPDDRVRLAREMEAAAMAQSDKVISCTSEYSDQYGESVKVHSNGFEGVQSGTSFTVSAESSVDDGNGGRPEDWDYASTIFFRDLPSPEKIGKGAVERALRKIGQTKLESGVYEAVVQNRAASRLMYPLYGPMQASYLQQKSSYLEGKLGQKIGSENLTLIDDPFIVSGHGSCLYDGEGMATKRRVMIDKGILKSYYIDWYYGQKLGMEPTTSSSTNLVLPPGNKSLDELIAQVKKGVLITGFIGGNSNSTTGDFSFGVFGMYIENGKIIKPISEMNISGNLMDLWNELADVGNDVWLNSSWRRPSLYFRNVQLSGL